MITLFWEKVPSKYVDMTYIRWEATWDGRFDNDPLIEKDDLRDYPEIYNNPFAGTIESIPPEKTPMEYGDFCADNKVVESILELLEMSINDPENFRKQTGNTCSYSYRVTLFGILSSLWD